MKKIYRVDAHDTMRTGYQALTPQFFVAESEEQLRAGIERDHEGTMVIDEIREFSVEAVVNLLNLYIE